MKAYVVFPPPDPSVSGCVLVWAESRGRAKSLGNRIVFGDDFTYLRARRVPKMDPCCPDGKKFALTNDDLPEGAPDFYMEDVYV